MIEQFSGAIYKYILDVEFLLLNEYKFDAISFIKDMTLMDLQSYVNRIIEKKREEQKERNSSSSKDMFAKSLVAIRDILNFMTGLK